MDLMYESIIESKVFTFVVGLSKKEYSVHEAAFSKLSKPLKALLGGPLKEAQELRVEWPDVDEKTFVRFTQWAYTRNYVTEEPKIVLIQPRIEISTFTNGDDKEKESSLAKADEQAMYSLQSIKEGQCKNSSCSFYGKNGSISPESWTRCGGCRTKYLTETCYTCGSALSDCSHCYKCGPLKKRHDLIQKFLDSDGINYPTTASVFNPRKNTKGSEDHTGVFLCHAKLYVLGDTYDIPELRQLSLHCLHATLTEFTLYPSRLNDIATLAKHIFNNTQSQDKIQDMIGHYYACIIEDASKHEGLKSLIDEIPDFAFSLISRMSERLA